MPPSPHLPLHLCQLPLSNHTSNSCVSETMSGQVPATSFGGVPQHTSHPLDDSSLPASAEATFSLPTRSHSPSASGQPVVPLPLGGGALHSAPHQGPLGLPAGMLPASVASPLGSTFGPMQGPATTLPGDSKPCLSAPTETLAEVPHASHAGALQAKSSLQVSSTAVQEHQLQALHLMAASWPAHSGARASVQPCSPNSGYYNFGARASDASCLTAVARMLPQVCNQLIRVAHTNARTKSGVRCNSKRMSVLVCSNLYVFIQIDKFGSIHFRL